MLIVIFKIAYELPFYSPSNYCVVLLFLSLLSGIHGVSVACRTPDSVLTGHKGEHLVIIPARNLVRKTDRLKTNEIVWENCTKIIT